MARSLSCRVCRINLGEGETHWSRCGLRIAPLPRRQCGPATGETAGESEVPLTKAQAFERGALGGVALVLLSAVIALVVTRGDAFAAGMSNATFFVGGIVLTFALLLCGVRIPRLVGDVETMRRPALAGGDRLGPRQRPDRLPV